MYNENQPTLNQKVLLGQYLITELSKVEKHFIESSEAFYKVYKYKMPPLAEKHDSKKATKQDVTLDRTCKTLYKALAKITHPDISNLSDTFTAVEAAYRQLDIITLYSYAQTFNIKITKGTLQSIDKLVTERLDQIRGRTLALKNTIGWRWYNSSEKDREIIERFIEQTFKLEKL